MCCDKNKVGLTFGSVLAILHAAWVAIVASGYGQTVLDWKMSMHFIDTELTVGEFNLGTGIGLIAMAFVWGYIIGYVFTALWRVGGCSCASCEKCKQKI